MQSIPDRIERLEMQMSHLADELIGINTQLRQLKELYNAHQEPRTATHDASNSTRSQAQERPWTDEEGC